MVLRSKPRNCRGNFEVQITKPCCRFWGPNRETWATGFEVKLGETVATDFEAKPKKTVRVVLRPNHLQTVDLGFEAQPRNPRFSSSCAHYRPHTVSPDLPIVWPSSIRPVRPSPVLYTKSSTPSKILIAAYHVTPVTCTSRDKQTWFSKWNKDKGKTIKMSWIRIQISINQWLITMKHRNWQLDFSTTLYLNPLNIPLVSPQSGPKYLPSAPYHWI
jgi:hypothetical protein